jgi:hypothetical protein
METSTVVLTASIALAIISFILIVYFAAATEIIREAGIDSPYSFAKFQLLLWLLIIAPLFCLNWGQNFELPTLNKTALILLGIAAATNLTATVIKANQQSQPVLVGFAPRVLKMSSSTKTFWIDILTDDSGNLSITRLQNLVFTFIFIGIYIIDFFGNQMRFPDFDDTTFILMGISSASYVGGRAINK